MFSRFLTSCAIGSSKPLTGANPAQALVRSLAHSFKFSGRASRSEYWWTSAVLLAVSAPLEVCAAKQRRRRAKELGKEYAQPELTAEGIPAPGEIQRVIRHDLKLDRELATPLSRALTISYVITVVPTLSLSVRRLHDTNRSGHWMWINLVPVAGSIVSLVQSSQKPVTAGKRFD
ncbi:MULTISPECIES: DUF805 domain-containing protein [unclassified Rothia (in: high G+C Gram-positive bacteria)]|uniref:DUF805 domain-containing protein n=1 Tax=unclassified Rothia (in: high G+C Gram-positive bacteria) TaxID=2689056 RepID=UPI001959DFE7|nr:MULTISPECIES: DUF805 domain-containing protein [unclassified Rothia (in: high G+C Gram-positive bacteria)]MBM7051920.1 DUF805 domain-containing protein [Rothia sp. ZJ1223]QRZ62005.1 DUF805 domain-containing protein [Rothia sp. ZJ932]